MALFRLRYSPIMSEISINLASFYLIFIKFIMLSVDYYVRNSFWSNNELGARVKLLSSYYESTKNQLFEHKGEFRWLEIYSNP